MELKAVIEALRALKVKDWDVTVYSDSAYVVNAFQQKWLDKWQRNGWRNSKKEPVANQDLWQELLHLTSFNRVKIVKLLQHKSSLCVCELRSLLGIAQPTVSKHLKTLEEAGLKFIGPCSYTQGAAGMKDEVIVQACHRMGYDRAIRAVGVRFVEVTTAALTGAAGNVSAGSRRPVVEGLHVSKRVSR